MAAAHLRGLNFPQASLCPSLRDLPLPFAELLGLPPETISDSPHFRLHY